MDSAMAASPPVNPDTQDDRKRLMTVDLIREITRNLIGILATLGILVMLYRFVEMAPDDDRMNVMLLVIGYMGGLATGITTYYFGGSMRSAVAAALQTKGGPVAGPILPTASENHQPKPEKEGE